MEGDQVSEPFVDYGAVEGRLTPGMEAVLEYQEAVRRRMITAARVLDESGIPYAIIGGNAVAHYVGRVSLSAVRGTADVDLLLSRADLNRAKESLGRKGFKYRYAAGVHKFLDGSKAREGVHAIMAGEKVRAEYLAAAPTLGEVERAEGGFAVIPFAKLVEMKLTSYGLKDKVHLLDMIGVGLLPGDVMEKLPEVLRGRLQVLLDDPDQ